MNLEEIRSLTGGREVRVYGGNVEVRADEAGEPGWTIIGHASVFNQETVIWNMWREVVEPGAFDEVMDDDVRHLLNHDANLVLGRTKSNTLRIEQDDEGLAYEVDLNPEDPDAVSARAKLKRGDIDQSSFAFTVKEDSWEDETVDEETGTRTLPLRRIRKVGRLFDTSTVTYPAYEGADSGLRSSVLGVLAEQKSLDADVKFRLLRAIEEAGSSPETLLSALNEFERVVREAGGEEPGAEQDEPDNPEQPEGGDGGGEPDEGAAAEAEEAPDGAGEDAEEPSTDGDGDEPADETDAERFEREAMERRHGRRQTLLTT